MSSRQPFMKHIVALIIAAAMAFSSCTPQAESGSKTIYVSILPLRNLIEGIVGDDYPIEVLVPPGASPETFEPTPKQFTALNRSQLIFNVGLIDFETTLLDKVADRKKIIDLSHGIDLLEGSCSHTANHYPHKEGLGKHTEGLEGHEEHLEAPEKHEGHAHGIDPHVWTSPKALAKMAENAFEAIHECYPDSVKYEANYLQLRDDLLALDARTAAKINASGVRYFIIYHPALTYYARDYGLEQVAIEADGKEPSARRLAAIIRRAREDGTHKILYQSQFPASVAEVIARDIDAECIAIDPLCEEVIANIDAITDQITAR